MGWMVNHVQVGDRVAVADHEVGRSAAVEPGQPEELARGPAWPPTPARAQNALSVLGRPSARCLRLPIRTADLALRMVTFRSCYQALAVVGRGTVRGAACLWQQVR